MKKLICKLVLLSIILISVLSLFSCSQSTAISVITDIPAGPAVLTIVKGNKIKTYTMSQLRELPLFSGYAGQIDSDNNITGPNQYNGVTLDDLLNTVGGITSRDSVKVINSDNYTKTLTYEQVTTGNFDLFSSSNGQETTAPVMVPKVFLAYEKDGNPLNDGIGPLEFGIMTCQYRVTQESLWIKKVVRIEVIAAQ